MWVKGRIALCTPTGSRKRGEVFEVDDVQGAAWLRAGKADAASAPAGASVRAAPKPQRPRRQRRVKVPALPVEQPDQG